MGATTNQRRHEQWREIVLAYRRRHRNWAARTLPCLTAAEWDEYTTWVTSFGNYPRQGKAKRRLLAAARPPKLTVTVTETRQISCAVWDAIPTGAPSSKVLVHLGSERAVAYLDKDVPRRSKITMLPAGATRQVS